MSVTQAQVVSGYRLLTSRPGVIHFDDKQVQIAFGAGYTILPPGAWSALAFGAVSESDIRDHDSGHTASGMLVLSKPYRDDDPVSFMDTSGSERGWTPAEVLALCASLNIPLVAVEREDDPGQALVDYYALGEEAGVA